MFFFLKGGILLHSCSHSTLEKCDPLTAEVMHCILFYKILKVRMSHQSTDSVANDPPGEPAWPRWTEKKGKASRPVQEWSVARCGTVRRLRDRASFHPWCLELFAQTTVFQMEIHPRWNGGHDADRLEEMQRKQISVHKKPLCSIVLRLWSCFPLIGEGFQRCDWTLDSGNVQQCILSMSSVAGNYSG